MFLVTNENMGLCLSIYSIVKIELTQNLLLETTNINAIKLTFFKNIWYFCALPSCCLSQTSKKGNARSFNVVLTSLVKYKDFILRNLVSANRKAMPF